MDDEILIGEGVRLDARPASFATRMLGAIVDLVALGVAFTIIVIIVVAAEPDMDAALMQASLIFGVVLFTVIIPTAVETLSRGRSLGKLVTGLRIVRSDGGPVRFRHAFIRALTGVFELWMTLGGVALICSLADKQGRRVGDILAGTYAVRIRGGQTALPPIDMPLELSGWARSADILRLPDGLALAVRQFLGRTTGLHQSSRARLGMELAAQVEKFVSPGPPVGTHPERFLAAVLAERRDRELVIARRAQQAAHDEARLLHRLPHAVPDPLD